MNQKIRRGIVSLIAAICMTVSLVSLGAAAEVQAAKKNEAVFATVVAAKAYKGAKRNKADKTVYAVKVKEYASVYKKKSSGSKVVGRLYRGCGAYVIKTSGKWSYITSGSVRGWVASSNLVKGDSAAEFLETVDPRVAIVQTSGLRVRSTANTDGAVICKLSRGSKWVVTGSTSKFWKIRLTYNKTGYVAKDYVKVQEGMFTGITKKAEDKMAKKLKNVKPDSNPSKTEEEDTSSKKEETKKETTAAANSNEPTGSGKWVSLGTFKTTAYCPCARCNGSSNVGKTASGAKPVQGTTIAVDKNVIPLGSKIKIGDHVYIAQDTGVKGHTIDVYHNTHSAALNYGVKNKEVFIWRK